MPRFPSAALNPAQYDARQEQAGRDAESAAALVAALSALRHHLMVAQPEYVYSDVFSFGGTTTAQNNPYAFPSPFQTPSQYRVLQMAFTNAGTAMVSQQRGISAPGVTTILDPSAMVDGQVYAAPGALTVCGDGGWTDIPGDGQVFLAVAATGAAAYAVIQFRRRVSPAGVYAEGHS